MNSQQAIANPYGITVFGSAIRRVAPNIASITATVVSVEQKPADAFASTRRAAQSVQHYLRTLPIAEFGASQIALQRLNRFVNGVQQFAGYQAKISFRIRLAALDRVDEIVSALVEAGANEIERLAFETTHLRELRAEARFSAVAAALDKARDYCIAAGVTLGPVLHIEDVNPRTLSGNESLAGTAAAANDDGDGAALDPSMIEIGAAVFLACAIGKVAS